ncbi:MAG: Lrp/AsnC family transcriptional regulator [Alphaproteobacteria bacterium]|jgi:Lrp/AsnC family transcriptional regulator
MVPLESEMTGRSTSLDEDDRKLLRLLQTDATLPLGRLAEKIGLSKTAVWNRIQKLQAAGVILRQVVIVDPNKIGLTETFFVAIRTNHHNASWLTELRAIIEEMPAITEAHRMAGQIDYLLRVQVDSTRAFDAFYQELVSKIDLFDVASHLSMEVLKRESALPI